MKAAIEAVRKKEMGSYKASIVVNLPQTTLQSYVKDRQESSSEAIKQNCVGSKFFPCEGGNDLSFDRKKVFSLLFIVRRIQHSGANLLCNNVVYDGQ